MDTTALRDAITLLAGDGHHEMAERLEHVAHSLESAEAVGFQSDICRCGRAKFLEEQNEKLNNALAELHNAQPPKVEVEPVARLEREYDEDEPELRGDLVVKWLTGKELPEGAELYTEQPALEGGWEPIETAPRDGTEIILRKGDRTTAGCWDEWTETVPEYHATTGEYLGRSIQGGGAWWFSVDGGFADDDPPTHWMPLPAPPEEE